VIASQAANVESLTVELEPAVGPGADGHQAPQGLAVRQATESCGDFLHGLQIIMLVTDNYSDRQLTC